MASSKSERLVNLVICLLASRTFVTKERLRRVLEPYRNCPSDEAFERMFERDKEELRELGIPLEVGSADAYFDDEVGYRIAPGEYALPELSLEPDEAQALGQATRFWQQATLAQAASSALLKLKAAGVEIGPASPVGIEPRVRVEAPAFEPLLEAVYERQVVRFSYRRGDGEVRSREVEPWTIDSWRGRWYLAGYDLGRDDERIFRLDRISGPVMLTGRVPVHPLPDQLDVRSRVAAFALRPEGDMGTATVRVRKGTCFPLRRGASAIEEGPDGWDVLVLTYRDGFEGYVAEFGADVVVLEPPGLRDAVIRKLRALACAGPVLGAGGAAAVPSAESGVDEADLAQLRLEWEAAS